MSSSSHNVNNPLLYKYYYNQEQQPTSKSIKQSTSSTRKKPSHVEEQMLPVPDLTENHQKETENPYDHTFLSTLVILVLVWHFYGLVKAYVPVGVELTTVKILEVQGLVHAVLH